MELSPKKHMVVPHIGTIQRRLFDAALSEEGNKLLMNSYKKLQADVLGFRMLLKQHANYKSTESGRSAEYWLGIYDKYFKLSINKSREDKHD